MHMSTDVPGIKIPHILQQMAVFNIHMNMVSLYPQKRVTNDRGLFKIWHNESFPGLPEREKQKFSCDVR